MTPQEGGRVAWTIEANTTPLEQSLDSALLSVQSFKKHLESSDSKTNIFDSITKQAQGTAEALAQVGASLGKATLGTAQAGATALTTALVGLSKKGVQATDFLETSRVAMSGLTGSMQEGNKAMSIAANFWSNNPFQRIDVTQATQQLVQYGRTTNQLADDLKILGDISLSSGAPIAELARYFGRTAAAGRAMTLDIEMLSDRGIPIYRELAKQLGTTQAGVRDFASQGKIDFETFRKALESAIDPDAMAQYEETLARQKDRLSGSISMLAGDLAGYKIVNNELIISANGLEKTYTKLLNTLATGLRDSKLREGMVKIGEAIAGALDKIFKFYEVWNEKTQKMETHSATLEKVFGVLSKAINFIGENSEMLLPILGGALVLFGRLAQQLPVVNNLVSGFNSNLGSLTKSLGNLANKNPALMIGLSLLVAGFASAYKSSEEFRNAIKSLFESIGKIAKAIMPAIQGLVNAFVSLASSPAITKTLTIIAQALAAVANAIASLPTEILEALIVSLVFLAMYKHNKILAIASAITVVVGAISSLWDALKDTAGGIGNILDGIASAFLGFVNFITYPIRAIVTFFADMVQTFTKYGNDIMDGLRDGIANGAKGVLEVIGNVATGIMSLFTGLFGIHSPSTVFTQYGEFMSLGLANGIESGSSAVDKAIDKLASATLKKAQKVLSNKLEFGVIDYNGEYKEWKKLAKLFTEGSSQYESAIEAMEEARKNVNKQIIELQRTYNTELDSSIDRLKTMFSIFEQVDVSKGGMSGTQIITNLDKQVAQLQEYASAQTAIASSGLDKGFIEELQSLGVESVNELQAIAGMTATELSSLNDLWLEKQEIATKEATRQMAGLKNDTLQQISELKDGIDGETVDVQDVGGRIVTNIGEGVTGALPTLESSLADLGKYITNETKSTASSVSSTVDDVLGDIQNSLDQTKQDIEKSFTDVGNKLKDTWNSVWPILVGIGGFLAATKILPFLKNVTSGIGGLVSTLRGAKAPAKDAGEAISGIGGTASKVAGWADIGKDVVKKIATIAEIFVAIVALSYAMKLAWENMQGIDFATMIGHFTLIGIAVAGLGAISYIIDKFDWKTFAKGLIVIAGIALDLILLAKGMGELDRNMQSDFDVMVGKIGAMGIAVLEIGVLAGIIGGLIAVGGPIGAIIAVGGIAALLGIAADIAALGAALGELDRNMTSDFDVMVGKIGAMGAAVGAIGALATSEGLADMLTLGATSRGIENIKRSAEAVIVIAQSIRDINEVQGLDINEDIVTQKFNVIKKCLEGIQGFTSNGLIGDVINFFTGGGFDLNKVKDLTAGVKAITEVGRPLAEMPNLTDQDAEKLGPIQTAFDKIKDIRIDGNIGKKSEMARQAADAMGAINRLANELINLPEVTDKSQSLENVQNAIKIMLGGAVESINTRINDFKVATITLVDTIVGAFTEKEGRMYDEGSIFATKFSEGMASKKDQIANTALDWQGTIWNAIEPKLKDEYYQGQALANNFKDGIGSVDMKESGLNAVRGFVEGVEQGYNSGTFSAAYNAGKNLAAKVLQGIQDRGKEGSPWKTTFQSGAWAAEGLFRGLKDNETLVVGEAKSLAGQVVDALSLEDTSVSPRLNAGVAATLPLMSFEDTYDGSSFGRRNVIIEQTNNNYTNYSIEKLNRDLAWEISRV